MLANTEAIILGYINYSESSIILRAYTKDFGYKSFIIRGIRTKKKKKITLGQLQPLTILDIEFNNLKNVEYANSIQNCIAGSDLIIIHTEWNDFKSINFRKLSKNKKLIIYDMRNIFSPKKIKKLGIKYYGIGR